MFVFVRDCVLLCVYVFYMCVQLFFCVWSLACCGLFACV